MNRIPHCLSFFNTFFVLIRLEGSKIFVLTAFTLASASMYAQPCTQPGQTPSTAIPVCGSTSFSQSKIPSCNNGLLFAPGCPYSGIGYEYSDINPFWYSFTCSASGTLGFHIDPHALDQDFDWQLFDVTGKNPDDVYKDSTLVVAGNWAGSFGSTGTSGTGSGVMICASDSKRFNAMPELIEGHDYLLLISCFINTGNGYTLFFEGGTAVINTPLDPHLLNAEQNCYQNITLKLTSKVKCNSLTSAGDEFTLSPAGATIISATAGNSSVSPYFDELTLTLSNTLTTGNYQLIINNGSDGNTLKNECDRYVPAGERVSFSYTIPEPIFADSIGPPACSPDSVTIYFPKPIDCSSVAANGSDFVVNGPSAVTVIAAEGDCKDGLSRTVVVYFSSPVYQKGIYSLSLKAGTDGTTIIDECNLQMPLQTLTFPIADTVSADFSYNAQLGCRVNTVTFSHDGAHDVNNWNWIFNKNVSANTQTPNIDFPAISTNEIQLIASNAACSDTAVSTIIMNNEVKANFELPVEICFGDPVIVTNTSMGEIDTWEWSFGNIGVSGLKDPAPQHFPQINSDAYYTVQLKVSNNTIGCSDTISKQLHVLNSCIIAVPSAFTPNNDGKNDLLGPINVLQATTLEFQVYNRWGQLVFSARNRGEKWDGRVNGILQPSGVFVWFLKYTVAGTGQQFFKKGTTMLIR